jgi:hypothetical protein
MKRRSFLGKAAGLVATMTALSGMGAGSPQGIEARGRPKA